ncbi:MAG TPA: (d)CMP kinase [Mycobacteriales bacterium]|jgi:cytidylate kinase|nr:(d)CMP kinase [Mycobacteriales bacterium]
MQRRNLVVAIDGPSGSGKSTVARGVALALGLRYLDTGAMYRAVTWLALHRGIALDAGDSLAALASSARVEVDADPNAPMIAIEGTDVTTAVRDPEVTAAVSAVSAVPGVRQAMVRRQRELIGDGGIVVEGRDIGTTVVPEAAVKIFLIADATARARRRAAQDIGLGHAESSVTATEAELARRDTADSTRVASPLTQAPDAVVVDSTALDADRVIQQVVGLAEAAAS